MGQQTAPYQLLQVFEHRRDDIIDQLTDRFGTLCFITDYAAVANVDSIDAIELDTPQFVQITDQQADLTITAHLTFTATTTYQEPNTGIDDPDEKAAPANETGTKTVQPTVRVPVELRFQYDDIASLNDSKHATIRIERVNDAKDIVFELERPEDPN